VRLSELLQQPEFKNANITIIGTWKTMECSYAVIGYAGQAVMPINMLIQHPIPMKSADDGDPEIDPYEVESIRRRFKMRGRELRFPR
jgi:hypothetical protein